MVGQDNKVINGTLFFCCLNYHRMKSILLLTIAFASLGASAQTKSYYILQNAWIDFRDSTLAYVQKGDEITSWEQNDDPHGTWTVVYKGDTGTINRRYFTSVNINNKIDALALKKAKSLGYSDWHIDLGVFIKMKEAGIDNAELFLTSQGWKYDHKTIDTQSRTAKISYSYGKGKDEKATGWFSLSYQMYDRAKILYEYSFFFTTEDGYLKDASTFETNIGSIGFKFDRVTHGQDELTKWYVNPDGEYLRVSQYNEKEGNVSYMYSFNAYGN
jgi:hypothetical protein